MNGRAAVEGVRSLTEPVGARREFDVGAIGRFADDAQYRPRKLVNSDRLIFFLCLFHSCGGCYFLAPLG
jgi:hypothetical protein